MKMGNFGKAIAVLAVLAGTHAAPAMAASNRDLTKSDLRTAAGKEGCDAIPYADLKQKCKTENTGLHGTAACDAPKCRKSTRDQNGAYTQAAEICVAKRTKIAAIFAQAKNLLNAGKGASGKKAVFSRDMKGYATTIIGKITAGEPTHATELSGAKDVLSNCKTF